jgi:dihydroorotase
MRSAICTADQVNQEVDDINREIAAALNTHHMVVAIEEVLIPSKPSEKCFVNFSKKSYMF